MKKRRVAAIFPFLLAGTLRGAALPRAHAHNDYFHTSPLLDALSHGFCSVEADVLLEDGKLLVGHGRGDLRPERTLERLYLDPLARRVEKNGGSVYPGGSSFTLLVDIKTEAEKTYAALRGVLARYSRILTTSGPEGTKKGAVTVVVSGNRPIETISGEKVRYCGIDGRLSDLDSSMPPELLPLISDNWWRRFTWRGEGSMPAAEHAVLLSIVKAAHAKGRRVRFWATPHEESLWKVLCDAGVDLINADDLGRLAAFLRERSGDESPLWRCRLDFGDGEALGSVLSPPAVTADRLYVTSAFGDLIVLDRETGRDLWALNVGSPILSQPAVAGGMVFFGASDGTLYGFEAGDPDPAGWPMWGGGPGHNGTNGACN